MIKKKNRAYRLADRYERVKAVRKKLSQRTYIPPTTNRKPDDAHIILKEDWYPGDDVYAKLLSR
jgi:hypothetical protein